MPTFEHTVSELFDLQRFSIKMGLHNITALCNHLGNPQNKFPTIHVAGTNGKGTTSAILQKLLSNHGYNCGLYTSPHLVDFRERIRVNDKLIEKNFLIYSWKRISKKVAALQATFFDSTTAIAFDYFNRQHVDIAVIETGLGGRLDSTNIIKPTAAIFTPIHYDHMKQLGENLSGIAAEKAAIIKTETAVFVSHQEDDVLSIIRNHINDTNETYYLKDIISPRNIRTNFRSSTFDMIDKIRGRNIVDLDLNLAGEFQIQNAALAYLVCRWFIEKNGIEFSEKILRDTLININWPGRLQCIQTDPIIYLDVSHNYSGIRSTLDFVVSQFKQTNLYLLIGLLSDKAVVDIVKMIYPHFNKIVVSEPLNDRKLEGDKLAREFKRHNIEVVVIKEITSAYELCLRNLRRSDVLLVMGSHFLIGPLMEYLQKKHLTSD